MAGLEETIVKLTVLVSSLEKSICRCQDRLLSPASHYMPGEEEEMVEETEEEGEEEEEGEDEEGEDEEGEDGLKYVTDTPSGGSYMTPPSTGGHSSPSPVDSDPENNVVLRTEGLEACIEAFLEEAEEDLEMNDLPPLENSSPLPVLAPVFPGFVPFAVSTGQHCVLPKSLLRKVYHPYKDPVGRCCCEPGGWCNNLPVRVCASTQ